MRGISRLKMGLQQNLPRQQQGMTMLGLVFLICFIGVFAFGVIRLTPLYLNYMKVIGVVDGVVAEFDGQSANAMAIRRSIGRRFDVESVSEIVAKEVKVTPVDGGLQVSAVYNHSTPFIGNISFTVHFDKTEVVRR